MTATGFLHSCYHFVTRPLPEGPSEQFTSFTTARLIQGRVGLTKIVTTLAPLRVFSGCAGGQEVTSNSRESGPAREIASALQAGRYPGH